MFELLGYLSGILMIVSAIPYTRDILRGNTKPQRATWLIWAVLNFIALFSQFAKGGTFSLLLTVGDALAVLLVFILSFKYGVGGTSKYDKLSLLGAGFSLLLWYLTKEPAVALILVIIIDFIGAHLTIKKAYNDPKSETPIAWLIASIAGFVGAISVGEFNFILILFPIYICLVNLSVVITIILGRNKKTL